MGDFFGVDQGAVANSIDNNQQEQSLEAQKAPQPEATKAEEILDLDKLERFRFDGKEWSPKDLKNSYLMREDYTRKTQEISEARKYADNFKYDLRSLVQNPGLWDRFVKIYPKEYIESAKEVLALFNSDSPQKSSDKPQEHAQIDPSFLKEFQEVKGWIQSQTEAQRAAAIEQSTQWLDNQYATLFKKYPNAVEEVVTTRAQALIDMGNQVNDQVLSKLFEQSHKEMTDRFVASQQNKVKEQIKTGLQGKDTGTGGSAPTSAPKQFKTFKEAREAWLSDINTSK